MNRANLYNFKSCGRPYAPPPATSFFPLTLFISICDSSATDHRLTNQEGERLTNNEHMNASPPTPIGKINAFVTASLYESSTPASCPGGEASRTWVAPAPMMTAGSTPVVCFGSCLTRVLEKMFCAIETDKAPPRVLKKIARASTYNSLVLPGFSGFSRVGDYALPEGMSFALSTTCTAMKGICTEAPAPIPVSN